MLRKKKRKKKTITTPYFGLAIKGVQWEEKLQSYLDRS